MPFRPVVTLLLIAAAAPLAFGTVAVTQSTFFDAIADAAERDAFRTVWNTRAPAEQRGLAERFVARFPASIVLREAYELAAHASAAAGDAGAAMTWAERSLRILPENPSLLVLAADLSARRGDLAAAGRRARLALEILARADAPAPLSAAEWNSVRDGHRAIAHTILARAAAARRDYPAASDELLAALALNRTDADALSLLGVVRAASGDHDGAARALSEALRQGGAKTGAAKSLLDSLFAASPLAARRTFEEFVASQKFALPDAAPPAVAAAAGEYAGSNACRTCHPREYANWQQTGMARMLRPYQDAHVIGDFSGGQLVDSRARPTLVDGRPAFQIRSAASGEWMTYRVDYTIGSKWQQAYATARDDGRIVVFPLQFRARDAQWLNYWAAVDEPGSARADIGRFHEVPPQAVYQTTCAPCHTSQLTFKGGQATPAAASFREPGVNCEMCHGPSLAHAERRQAGTPSGAPPRATPVRFREIAPAQSVAICAQCHAQSAVHDAAEGGAVNYATRGEWYRSYRSHLFSAFPKSAFYRDGRFRATTFISESFARSRCYREGGATCATCHNPHPSDAATNPTSLKTAGESDEMCVTCHAGMRAAPERHTRHRAGSEASRCVTCHMPRIQEALLFSARSHQIDDIPDAEMTARFGPDGSPNVCLGCHADRTIGWLQAAMRDRTPR